MFFGFDITVVGFKKHKLKTPMFGQEGGLQQKVFFFFNFLSTCVLQNVKRYRFFRGPFLGQILGNVQKHYKNRYFSTFLKQ